MFKAQKAFTIVELVIVVIVIGILASIVLVGYKNATKESNTSAVKSDLQTALTSVKRYLNEESRLPTSLAEAGVSDTSAATFNYVTNSKNFCIGAVAKSGGFQLRIDDNGTVSSGACPPLAPLVVLENCFATYTSTIQEYFTNEYNNPSSPACPKDLVIPVSIRGSQIAAIGDDAFNGVGLKSVVIPDGVTAIGDNAFYDNDLLTAIIPQSVSWIGADAFKLNNLTSVTVLPGSVFTNPFDAGVVINYY